MTYRDILEDTLAGLYFMADQMSVGSDREAEVKDRDRRFRAYRRGLRGMLSAKHQAIWEEICNAGN